MQKTNRSIKERMEQKRIQQSSFREKKRETLKANITKSTISELNQEIEDLKKQIFDIQKAEETRQNTILSDLLQHTEDKKSPFSSETVSLAIELRSISPKAYSILVKRLNFPKDSVIDEAVKEVVGNFPSQLTSLEGCCDIINSYKEKYKIPKSTTIDACLAVDALYFKPDVTITEDGEISGILYENSKVTVSDKAFAMFSEDPSELEKFLAVNSNAILRAGFVFQVQPYDISLKPFVIHIKPSVNGKAGEEIVNILKEIKRLAKNRNINIKSFAFDGDNAYKHLHEAYYESYIHKAIETHSISFTHSRTFRVVSDYLHIIKRLRYRLLSSLLHAGFDEESDVVFVPELQEILSHLPSTVWCNESFTKMHDKLPIALFQLDNLLKLINSEYFAAAAY